MKLNERRMSEVRHATTTATARVRRAASVHIATQREEKETEHERLLGVWDRFFAKVDALEFERPTTPPSIYEEALVEKFRKQGLKV